MSNKSRIGFVEGPGMVHAPEVTDTTSYSTVQDRVEKKLNENLTTDRFLPFDQRENKSGFCEDHIRLLSHGKYETLWRGMQIMKDPLDFVIYQQLLWHEKPRTIFEIGTFSGACASWMADTMEIYGLPCHVYSLDIDHSLLHPKAKESKNVSFIQGDAKKIENVFPITMMKSFPHPWIISEDAHINLFGCMEHFHKFMEPGDYFIIEDTCPDTPKRSGQGLIEDKYEKWGSTKLEILAIFMEKYSEFYAVDSFYTDFFGYNGTYNWNGYIRRMK